MPLDLIKFGMRALIKRFNANRQRKIPKLDSNGEPLARTQSRAASIHESMYSSRVNFLQRAQRNFLPPPCVEFRLTQFRLDRIGVQEEGQHLSRRAATILFATSCDDWIRSCRESLNHSSYSSPIFHISSSSLCRICTLLPPSTFLSIRIHRSFSIITFDLSRSNSVVTRLLIQIERAVYRKRECEVFLRAAAKSVASSRIWMVSLCSDLQKVRNFSGAAVESSLLCLQVAIISGAV